MSTLPLKDETYLLEIGIIEFLLVYWGRLCSSSLSNSNTCTFVSVAITRKPPPRLLDQSMLAWQVIIKVWLYDSQILTEWENILFLLGSNEHIYFCFVRHRSFCIKPTQFSILTLCVCKNWFWNMNSIAYGWNSPRLLHRVDISI